MLYIAMIDIIDDEQFTFVFEFFQCETKKRKSTPKLQKFLYSSSNFRMSDIDEYEDVDVSLWDDDEDFPIADQSDK